MSTCPFCQQMNQSQPRWSGEHSAAFPDGYPISPGHTLVVPRVHVADLFDLPVFVRDEMWALVDQVHSDLAAELSPDGFNIGVNVGTSAGQTIGHAHIHVIPRYEGDVQDPRGGVRWVIADRAAYWA